MFYTRTNGFDEWLTESIRSCVGSRGLCREKRNVFPRMKGLFTYGIPAVLVVLFNAGCGVVKQNRDCLEEGALYSYKQNPNLPDEPCCEGSSSVQINSSYNKESQQCELAPGGFFRCLACGDGNCNQDVEEPCNCPSDCALPSS